MIYLAIGGAFYLLIIVLLAVFQRRLIYLPARMDEAAAIRDAGFSGLKPWRDAEGGIAGWRSANREQEGANRLVVFHGNAGSAMDREHYADGFEQLEQGSRWEVFLFEYPGYGARAGEPGRPEFTRAALAAVADLKRADARPVFLLGESIGAGTACDLAEAVPEQIAGLFLMTPFARLGDVGARHFPLFPVRRILRDRWDNVRALQNYRGPLAVMIAGEDEVVSPGQGELLFKSYAGPKRRWIDPRGTHNMLDLGRDAAWWREVSDFLLEKRL